MRHGANSLADPAVGFGSKTAMQNARAIQAKDYSDLNYPNKKQFVAFPSYTCLSNFAEDRGCNRILEIGAGLSTAVWADFSRRTGAKVCSIDADFSRMLSYVRNTRHEMTVSRHTDLVEGTTILADELLAFYTAHAHRNYGGVEFAACMDVIDRFQSRNCSIRRWYLVSRIAGRWNWSARDLMTRESSLVLPRRLLNIFSLKRDFDNDVSFLRDSESEGRGGVIDRFAKNGAHWDLVFFDSGELSSMIEWTKLKDRIAVGGFAAFHDIFFPKSIKNIVPCAAVLADPDWEMVFCDNSTRQGLMIARKLR